MKKNLVALLLVLVVVSFGLFADASEKSFQVETTIAPTNDMKLVTASVTTPVEYDDATAFGGTVTYNGTSYTAFPYIAAKSNSRGGFTITMTAKAMASQNETGTKSYIGYKVSAGDSSITVLKGDADAAVADPDSKKVIVTGAQSVLHAASEEVSIVITEADYDNALQETYVGTITFNFQAN